MARPHTEPPRVALGTESSPELRREVAVLCATEITNWGAIVYAFVVASSTIAAAEGWRLTHLLGAFTVAQVVAGLASFWVGRRIDAVGPRALMSGGSVLGAVALLVVASSTSVPAYYAGWVLAGLAMSATLYAPAFAAITGWAGTNVGRRVRALTAITLVAGLASTVFAPLTAWLLDAFGWRSTYLVMSALVAATGAAHWWGLRKPWPDTLAETTREDPTHAGDFTRPFRIGDFRLLVASMALGGFCVHAVVVNLVPLLLENGLNLGSAAAAMAVGGVGQVSGRLLYSRLSAMTGPAARGRLILALVAATTVAFAEIDSPWLLVAVVSFACGIARGMFTLVQATAISDRWGPRAFGARNGVLSGWTMAAAALAPWAGSYLADHVGGYPEAYWLLAAGTLLAAAGIRPGAARPYTRPFHVVNDVGSLGGAGSRTWRHGARHGQRH